MVETKPSTIESQLAIDGTGSLIGQTETPKPLDSRELMRSIKEHIHALGQVPEQLFQKYLEEKFPLDRVMDTLNDIDRNGSEGARANVAIVRLQLGRLLGGRGITPAINVTNTTNVQMNLIGQSEAAEQLRKAMGKLGTLVRAPRTLPELEGPIVTTEGKELPNG